MIILVIFEYQFRYFNRGYAILLEFVPQIIFLMFLFGYLCLLMFIKWTKYYAGAEERTYLSWTRSSFCYSIFKIFIE